MNSHDEIRKNFKKKIHPNRKQKSILDSITDRGSENSEKFNDALP
jgi:hypothetical protein